jgi:predicted lipoprotein with Yx(FWY)xxD motif
MAAIRSKFLLAAGVSIIAAAAVQAATEGTSQAQGSAVDAAFATPDGITLQPLGKAQGYDLGKQTAAFLAREQIAYADAKGMTLYTYAKDQPGRSNCVDACAAQWKPLPASAEAKPYGNWTIIARADGSRQWALKGEPVYTYVKDVDPGSVGGNSPARFGARRIGGDGKPVGGGIRGAGVHAKPDVPLPADWKPALVFPVTDMKMPDGIGVREVPDAFGLVLVNYKDQTLYTFDGDPTKDKDFNKDGKWTPAAAPQLSDPVGDFAFALRADGVKQWTYKGRGLYTYAGDYAADDAYGVGADPHWTVASVVRYYMPANVALYNTPGQGKILATTGGKTLYKRDGYILQSGGGHSLRRGQPQRPAVGRDIGINALCDADCQKVWHPFLAPADARPRGFWSVAARPDGTKQWVYQGYALWTYDQDKKPGDMHGNDSFQYAFADTPDVASDAPKKAIDLGTPTDGAPALYWAIAIP